MNSPETILFKKGEVLWGLHRTMRPMIEKKTAIVCEGQIDLITAFEAGVKHDFIFEDIGVTVTTYGDVAYLSNFPQQFVLVSANDSGFQHFSRAGSSLT